MGGEYFEFPIDFNFEEMADKKLMDMTLEELMTGMEKIFATKDDLERFATKEDLDQRLERYPTKDDLEKSLERYATKDDLVENLERYATKDDLVESLERYATKDDLVESLERYATKDDLVENLERYATREEIDMRFKRMVEYMDYRFDELDEKFVTRKHFDEVMNHVDTLVSEIENNRNERIFWAQRVGNGRIQ